MQFVLAMHRLRSHSEDLKGNEIRDQNAQRWYWNISPALPTDVLLSSFCLSPAENLPANQRTGGVAEDSDVEVMRNV